MNYNTCLLLKLCYSPNMERVTTIVISCLVSLVLIAGAVVVSHKRNVDNTDSTINVDNVEQVELPAAPKEVLGTEDTLKTKDALKLEIKDSEDVLEKPTESDTLEDTQMVNKHTHAIITTPKGNIVLELFPNDAPNTVSNFASKAASGFYNDLTFHRVEDWVVQGGDPLGNGTGGGDMPTELNDIPFVEGSLGVARGMNINISNDSQFFVCTKDCSWLTGQYTNFGKVVEGMDIVKSIEVGDSIEEVMVK